MPAKKDLQAFYEETVTAFEALGCPRDLLNIWAIPKRDAETLLQKMEEVTPTNILEIGTFVGMTTLLMAMCSPEATRIHTVDPNFPLHVEMRAMGCRLDQGDCSVRAQDLGKSAATRLGLQEKIVFHEGGFSTGDTFAANNANPTARVPVIGPRVCKECGPFDFIFIDGLHYESSVFADLMLAAAHLVPGGVIAVHDVIGRWGSNVRRGVFRFLANRDDFIFCHDRYAKMYDAVGFLQHCIGGELRSSEPNPLGQPPEGLIQGQMLPNLAAALVTEFLPHSVIQIGCENFDLSELLKERGVSEVHRVALSPGHAKVDSDFIKTTIFRSGFKPDKKYDLCLCLGSAEAFGTEYRDEVIEACVDSSDTVIFASTPPGEMGSSHPYQKPIAYWTKKFYDLGYILHDRVRPLLEPLYYFDDLIPGYRLMACHLLNLYLATKAPVLDDVESSKTVLQQVLVEKEARIEDLALQSFFQNLAIWHERNELAVVRRKCEYLEARHEELMASTEMLVAKCLKDRLTFLTPLWRLGKRLRIFPEQSRNE